MTELKPNKPVKPHLHRQSDFLMFFLRVMSSCGQFLNIIADTETQTIQFAVEGEVPPVPTCCMNYYFHNGW